MSRRNVSFQIKIFHGGNSTLINSFDKTKFNVVLLFGTNDLLSVFISSYFVLCVCEN